MDKKQYEKEQEFKQLIPVLEREDIMKLSSILKNVISNKYEICDRLNNIDYHIDYLRDGFEVKDFGCFQYHTTPVSLPQDLLKREVKYLDVNSTTKELVIVLK